MDHPADVEASCAICGAPPSQDCPHESQRLELAMNQAMARWAGLQSIRDWVLNHARNQVAITFEELRAARYENHLDHLQTLPCYTLYQRYHGNPPLNPPQLRLLHTHMDQAQAMFKAGVDEDWRRSCMRYPEILDYYFSLVEITFPHDRDSVIREPRFGSAQQKETRKLKTRRDSVDLGHRKKDRRRSRGRTPPPAAPMSGSYKRR